MKWITPFALLLTMLLSVFSCSAPAQETNADTPPANLSILRIDTIAVPSSVRALQVVSNDEIWFAGSEGVYGFSKNGGQSWTIDSLEYDTIKPHFRSIAVTENGVFLLAIGSPALLFRSADQGKNWDLVYREDHPSAFYDAMQFGNDRYGIAMGDPTDGCLSVIRTDDGGANWQKVPCSNIPAAEPGEAAFAASNSNLAIIGEQAWMVSGGTRSRVYHSTDQGRHWEVYETPIQEGGQMTGIYTVAFHDEQLGIIFGGDWNAKEVNTQNKAISRDGGKSWELISDGTGPGYRSSVKFIPATNGQGLMACGIPGISMSVDGGEHWIDLSQESYYTLGFGATYRELWLAGSGKIGKVIFAK